MERIKTISEIIVNNTQPDIEDNKLMLYTDYEVRNMIYESSKQAFIKGFIDGYETHIYNPDQEANKFIEYINQ